MTVPPQPGPPQQPAQPPGGWPQPGGWQQPAGQSQPGGWQQPGGPQQPAGWQQQGAWQVPGPGGWPGQPPMPAPAPPPVTKRIPEDQPFIVRPSMRKRGLLLGGILLFVALLFACPVGLATSDDSGNFLPALAVFGCILVFFGLLIGLQLYLITSGGPILAVGPTGLWIKTRPTRGQAIWLQWEGIERIYRRRWSLEKMVCVKARDPRAGNNLGAFTALDSSMQQLFFGSGFTATVVYADKSEQEIMAALAHYGAGRCPIM